MATGAIIARILTQYSDKGSKAAARDIAKLGKSFDNFGRKSAKAFGLAVAASGAFAIKIGSDAVNAAIEDQKSQALLANSLRNTVGANDSAIASTETYITAMQKQFSVVDDELRPAMAALTAATGSVTAAQSLMQTALDVSANSGTDLATSVAAIVAGTRGQFKALGKLVPGLDAATIATKDYGKILDKVSKLTAGAAAARANTLQYKLMGLKIAYGEILETLGYALLPVLEKFATVISTKILPVIDAFVKKNKEKLAASFQVAADFALKFLTVAISFGDWISNHTTAVTIMAGLIAGMFAVDRIAAFIIAIGKVSQAFAILRTTAAGAAVAEAFATFGVTAAVGAVAAAGVAAALGVAMLAPGTTAAQGGGGKSMPASAALPKLGANGAQVTAAKLGFPNNFGAKPGLPVVTPDTTLADYLKALLKNTGALNKNTKTQADLITAEAVRLNLAKQAAISGSSSIAIGGIGSKPYGNTTVVVNNAGSVISNNDLITSIVNGLERTNRRSFGTVGAFDR
jgi:hypothetical protein